MKKILPLLVLLSGFQSNAIAALMYEFDISDSINPFSTGDTIELVFSDATNFDNVALADILSIDVNIASSGINFGLINPGDIWNSQNISSLFSWNGSTVDLTVGNSGVDAFLVGFNASVGNFQFGQHSGAGGGFTSFVFTDRDPNTITKSFFYFDPDPTVSPTGVFSGTLVNVPEPGVLSLLIVGLAAMGFSHRRRRIRA